MNEHIIQDWLAECSALSPVEVSSFANSLKHNDELIKALYSIFQNHTKFYSLIDPISKQLFNFYRSREVELKLFTLQFLPSLIYIYLNSVAQGDKKSYSSVETLLIGIYNLEVVDDSGQPAVISFRLPSLAQASIYHEPMSLAHASLTETALRRLEECNTKLITWGPHPQVETLNAQNRLKTITGLMFIYNRYIGSLHKLSLNCLCRVSSLLASQGFGNSPEKVHNASNSTEGMKSVKLPRIPVSSQLFLELLCGVYYAMYNDFGYEAMEAVVDIYNRSCLECYANVIIVANAIRNSSHGAPKGQPSDGPMGISVALSPATNTITTVNKFMITNASFRTKKLPDDLELEVQSGVPPGGVSSANDSSDAETHSQKSLRKGKWKGWNWLHNASNRQIPEENEEPNPPKCSAIPDDIPIIPKDDSGAGADATKPLAAITEEKEETGFSGRGSSFRGKETMTKNLQKLGIGKKLKEGKSSARTNLAGSGTERKQSTSMQLSTLIEKVSLKAPVVQNGDFAQIENEGHSPLGQSRKRNSSESETFGEVPKEGTYQEVGNKPGFGFVCESQSTQASYALDMSSSNDEPVGLYNSNKTVEDKPLMQISSV